MTLEQAIAAAGMTPPRSFPIGRFVRFPAAGKGASNRSGWCKVLEPGLAVYGDWTTQFKAHWSDGRHSGADAERLIKEALRRADQFDARQRKLQAEAAEKAAALIRDAVPVESHPYLARKGFPNVSALTVGEKLVLPMRALRDYRRVISAQLIDEDGQKRFVTGSRVKGGIYRLGAQIAQAKNVLLCEGYATGLTVNEAMRRLPGPSAVVVCFSAGNLEHIADELPQALIAADNDASGTGETFARRTGKPWVMPREVGTDFNDLMLRAGLPSVVKVLRELCS